MVKEANKHLLRLSHLELLLKNILLFYVFEVLLPELIFDGLLVAFEVEVEFDFSDISVSGSEDQMVLLTERETLDLLELGAVAIGVLIELLQLHRKQLYQSPVLMVLDQPIIEDFPILSSYNKIGIVLDRFLNH